MRQLLVAALLALTLGCRPRAVAPSSWRVPPHFSIEPAASPARLGPVSAFTFDSRGRPVVVKQSRFVTLLLDANLDGSFESEKIITTAVNDVRGLFFDGRILLLLGSDREGHYGLFRLEDRNGDDETDTVELLAPLDPPEPGPHDIKRAADGAITFLHGGRWWRWQEEHRSVTVLATGIVNARSHAHTLDGEALVLDAGSKDGDGLFVPLVSARLIHAVPWGEYGLPGHRFDALPVLTDPPAAAGGIEFYQHNIYPEVFRGALFEADSARGRIVARRVAARGATLDRAKADVGEFVTGEHIIITDLEVGPDGFLYFSCARPGNRGGLYRIRYSAPWRERWERWRRPVSAELALVRQAQPLSSWGHSALARQRDLREARWGDDLEALAQKPDAAPADRAQALLLLGRFGPKPKPGLLQKLITAPTTELRAATLLLAAALQSSKAPELVTAGLGDSDPTVRRRAAQAIDSELALPGVYPLLSDSDPMVRFAARRALERSPREDWVPKAASETNPQTAKEAMLALIRTASGRQGVSEREAVLEKLLPALADRKLSAEDRLDMLRLLVLASAGVTSELLRDRTAELLVPMFGSSEELNRALAPALSWAGGSEAIGKLLAGMSQANRATQIYYAQSVSGAHGWTGEQKDTMTAWFAQASRWPSVSAGSRKLLSELFDSFVQSALTREEGREARRLVPGLSVALGGPALTAEEIFEIQLAEPPPAASPGKGKQIFERSCASCHRVGRSGSEAAPDLTESGRRLQKAGLLEAILWPARTMAERFRTEKIDLADGSSIEALILREDAKVLLLKTAGEARQITILKSRVTGRSKLDRSIMPDGLLTGYDQQAVASLLEYLGAP